MSEDVTVRLAPEAMRRLDEIMERMDALTKELARVHEDFGKLTAKMPKADPIENAIDSAVPALVNLIRGKKRR